MFQHQHLSIKKTVHISCSFTSLFCLTEKNTCRHCMPLLPYILQELSWSWSYGSWIYNYICNRCPSTRKWWIRITLKAMWTRYNIMW